MSATAEASPRTGLAGVIEKSPASSCTVALGVLVWFAGDEGGFRKVTWMPATLLLAVVLLVCSSRRCRVRARGDLRSRRCCSDRVWGFCLLSMLWAGQEARLGRREPHAAVRDRARAVLALAAACIAPVLLGGYGLAIAAIATVELIRVAGGDQGIQFFEGQVRRARRIRQRERRPVDVRAAALRDPRRAP